MMLKKTMAASALALFAIHAAAAEPGWYTAPALGYTLADSDRGVDDALTPAVALGRHLNDRWSLEFNALTSEHDADAGGELGLTGYSLDVLRRFATGGRVTPFLTAGLGSLGNDFSPGGSREDFLAQAGAGLLIRAWQSADGAKTLSLRPEAKLRWDDIGGAGHLQDVVAGLGFQFDFGAPARAAALPVTMTPPPAPAPAPVAAPVAPPPPADSDGDGVLDPQDRCPDTPRGTAVDDQGCPRKGSITLAGVNFANNSAQLLPESLALLEPVAADLKRYPRLKVEVQGHTDSVGSEAYNLKLSQSRSEAVRAHLVTLGVAAEQLTARGYGEAQPVDANDTAEGRARNRRVALSVVDNPGDVEVKQAP